MELAILIAAVVLAFVVRSSLAAKPIAATSGDWFLVFDIDAEKKVLGLWFYPVIGFRHRDNVTSPITSRPDYVAKLAASRNAVKVNDTVWGVSVSYGRWLRDGAPFDPEGNPDYQDSSDFRSTIEGYLLGEFKLHFATPIPVFYQQQIERAVEHAKRER
jgi:hypothetical protein